MLLTARQAADRLGVKLDTLYAYVSRGRLRSVMVPGTRERRYRGEDVEALLDTRSGARPSRNPDPEALMPVLGSSICLIENGRFYYRGQDAVRLAEGATLEEVARELDPLPFDAHDAADLLATFVRGERICAAAKSLLARRIEETKVWREHGHRSAAHWVAEATGATVGAAARTLETARALEASGADMVTVAVRRVNLDRSKESLLDYLDPKKYFLLPNTAGCYTADEAIRAARLGREVGLSDWVKLEVIGDQATLYPDVQATLEATRVLVKEGFTILPYTSDDIVFAKRLLDAGAATIMPLGAPIGSGLGIQNAANIRILREMITGVPLVLDAGVGTASDAALAMELGADAVLMNTGIANAQDPVLMAEAMKHAVLAGREAYLAGRMPRKLYATASSPLEGVVR